MNSLSLIRWTGGKGRQLTDLLPLIPQSKVYVEPFGGGCSVLLNRERSEIEVYNDLDDALVNLFEVMRDPALFMDFRRTVEFMPYSRALFEQCLSFEGLEDRVQRAAAFYVMLGQSVNGNRLAKKGNWARSTSSMNLAERWYAKQDKLVYIHERVKNIQIECRDAIDLLHEWDSDDTTFYCDPPYILDTRKKKKYYAVEPGDEYHKEMIDALLQVRGAVVLSGYDHPIYLKLLDEGWWTDVYGAKSIVEAKGHSGTVSQKMEIVYRNPKACEAGVRVPLFHADEMGTVLSGERQQVEQKYL